MKVTPERNLKVPAIFVLLLMLQQLSPIMSNAQAKDNDGYKYKNTIYFETLGATGLGGSVNFKHLLQIGPKSSVAVSGGLGIIFFSWNEEQEMVIPMSITFIKGTKHSFEGGLGFSYLLFEDILAPNIALGYRYQNGKSFLWAGVVTLMFYEGDHHYRDYNGPHYDYMAIIPVPGFRIGTSF